MFALFSEAAGELVPRAVCLEVSCKTLSERRWKPSKDFVANRLLAAQLQLAPGTLLVLDETGLTTGALPVAGVDSIKAIGTLVTDRSLACDFSAYDINVPLELFIILVSHGKSIVKDADLTLPMQPAAESQQSSTGLNETKSGLDAARLYLGLATRLPRALRISTDMAEHVAGDFSEARQQFHVPSTLCNTWLSLARSFCLSHGEEELSHERWSAFLDLERQRLHRCLVSGTMLAA